MTKNERQEKVRKEYLEKLNLQNVIISWANHEIMIKTGNEEYPYILITCSALDANTGEKEIESIKWHVERSIQRQKALEEYRKKKGV